MVLPTIIFRLNVTVLQRLDSFYPLLAEDVVEHDGPVLLEPLDLRLRHQHLVLHSWPVSH